MFCETHNVPCVHAEAPEQSPVRMGATPLKLKANCTVGISVWPPQALLNPKKMRVNPSC